MNRTDSNSSTSGVLDRREDILISTSYSGQSSSLQVASAGSRSGQEFGERDLPPLFTNNADFVD